MPSKISGAELSQAGDRLDKQDSESLTALQDKSVPVFLGRSGVTEIYGELAKDSEGHSIGGQPITLNILADE